MDEISNERRTDDRLHEQQVILLFESIISHNESAHEHG